MKPFIKKLKKQHKRLKESVERREILFEKQSYAWQSSVKGVNFKTNTEIIHQQNEELECIIKNLQNLEKE